MIDRANICLPSTPLNPDLLTDPAIFATRHCIPDLDVQVGFNKRNGRRYANIHLLPNRCLSVYAEESLSGWRALRAELTAPSLLHGHNGVTIHSDRLLTAFLSRAAWHLLKILPDSSIADVIPGLAKDSDCYWSSLELAWHRPDPDGTLFRSFQNMGHPSIRSKSVLYSGESLTLPGKKMRFIAYRKDLQMQREIDRFHDSEEAVEPVLRFELSLKGDKLAALVAAKKREIRDAQRLVGFTLGDLRYTFRTFVAGLTGVTSSGPGSSKLPSISKFIARMGVDYNAPTDTACALYSDIKGLKAASASKLRKEARSAFGQIQALDLTEAFSDAAFDSQPQIHLERLEASLSDVIKKHAWDDRTLAEIYTDHFLHGFQPLPFVS